MRFAMKNPESDVNVRLEWELRRTSDAARHVPSPALRRRTLATLHELQFVDFSPRCNRMGWAIFTCSMLMAVIGLFAMMQQNGGPTAKELVKPPQHNHSDPSKSRPLDLTAIASVSIVQLDLSAPYRREAQLIARDAGRAWDSFRQQLPRLPAPAPQPSIDGAGSAPGA